MPNVSTPPRPTHSLALGPPKRFVQEDASDRRPTTKVDAQGPQSRGLSRHEVGPPSAGDEELIHGIPARDHTRSGPEQRFKTGVTRVTLGTVQACSKRREESAIIPYDASRTVDCPRLISHPIFTTSLLPRGVASLATVWPGLMDAFRLEQPTREGEPSRSIRIDQRRVEACGAFPCQASRRLIRQR